MPRTPSLAKLTLEQQGASSGGKTSLDDTSSEVNPIIDDFRGYPNVKPPLAPKKREAPTVEVDSFTERRAHREANILCGCNLLAAHTQRKQQRQLSIGMPGGTDGDADASAVALLTSPAARMALAAVGAVAMEVLKTAFWERLRDNVLSKVRVTDPFDMKEPYLDQAQVERVDKALMGVWDDLAKRLPNLVKKRPSFLGRSTALDKVRYRMQRTGAPVLESHDWHDDNHFETSEHCINILFSSLPSGEGGEHMFSGTIFQEEAGRREGKIYQNAAVGNEVGVQIFPGTSTVLDHADPFRYAQPAPGRLVVLFRIPTKVYHTAENNEDYCVAVEAIRAALLKVAP